MRSLTISLLLSQIALFTIAGASTAEEWCDKGDGYFKTGEYESAMEYYDQALGVDPEYADAWLKKGEAAIFMYEYEKAFGFLEKACELDYQSKRADSLSELAEFAWKYDYDADSPLSSGRIIPPEAELLYFRLQTHSERYSKEAYREVIGLLDRALEFDPDISDPAFARFWISKADLQFRAGDYEEALESSLNLIKLKPAYYDAYFIQWLSLSELGREAEAKACYDIIVESVPDYPGEFERIAYLYYHGNDNVNTEVGIVCYEEYLKANPGDYVKWCKKSRLERELGRYDDALRSLDETRQYFDGTNLAKYGSASIYAETGEKTKMLEELRGAIKSNPAFHGLSKRDPDFEEYRNDSDFKKMMKEMEPVKEELVPEMYFSLVSGGSYLSFLIDRSPFYDLEKGIICCDLTLEVDPDYIEAYQEKIRALNELGRYEELADFLKKAAEMTEGIDRKYAEYYVRARIPVLVRANKYEEAIKSLDQLPAEVKDSPESLKWRSLALAYLGKYEEAIECFDEAVAPTALRSDAFYLQARIHAISGNRSEMLESLSKAIYEDYSRKYNAQRDPVFEPYKDDPDFREVVAERWFE